MKYIYNKEPNVKRNIKKINLMLQAHQFHLFVWLGGGETRLRNSSKAFILSASKPPANWYRF